MIGEQLFDPLKLINGLFVLAAIQQLGGELGHQVVILAEIIGISVRDHRPEHLGALCVQERTLGGITFARDFFQPFRHMLRSRRLIKRVGSLRRVHVLQRGRKQQNQQAAGRLSRLHFGSSFNCRAVKQSGNGIFMNWKSSLSF